MKSDNSTGSNQDAALNLLRQKIDQLYDTEPPAKEELKQVHDKTDHAQPTEPQKASSRQRAHHYRRPAPHGKNITPPARASGLSKHQRHILSLQNSGKSVAEIQTAWHEYYVKLSDKEKHEVWQEFYAKSNQSDTGQVIGPQQTPPEEHNEPHHKAAEQARHSTRGKSKPTAPLKKQILNKVGQRELTPRQQARNHHIKSLVFGLGMGCLALLVLSFGFFNERFIAPFMTPSRAVTDTPIIIDSSAQADGPDPKIIIPKINVEAPIVFGQNSIDEREVQKSLEDGVLHYGITSQPGELGNAAFFGHSSNNLLNRGNYKFVFVLLSRLENGDTFMIQKDNLRYIYKVYDKKIVPPTDISVLEPDPDRPAIATLITCDPPGTATNRLVIFAEQIAPEPANNVASTARDLENIPIGALPSDAPSLWSRIRGWFSGS